MFYEFVESKSILKNFKELNLCEKIAILVQNLRRLKIKSL